MSDSVLALAKIVNDATRAASQAVLDKFDPPFGINVGLCSSYTDLLRGDCALTLNAESFLGAARLKGRAILSGKGGAGKTAIARRLAIAGLDAGALVVVVSLRNWGKASQGWNSSVAGAELMELLLDRLADRSCSVSTLRNLPPTYDKFLVIDGLNEVPSVAAQAIIDASDELAASIVGLTIVVLDRLIRRKLRNESRWLYAMPCPVAIEIVDKVLAAASQSVKAPQDKQLLTNPFCLDAALRNDFANSPLKVIEGLVTQYAVNEADVAPIAHAAYTMYARWASRAFAYDDFAALTGKDIAARLVGSGLLQNEDGIASFWHHWVHDYFASRYVAATKELWSHEDRQRTLNALTFDGNSFDAVGFVLELLEGADLEHFIQAVYDWNPYAAGYALAELDRHAANRLDANMRTIVLAMLAERMFDRNVATATKARDALSLFRAEDARGVADMQSLSQLIDYVRALNFDNSDAKHWQSLFTRSDGEAVADNDLRELAKDDSVAGWTMANVAKRLALSSEQIAWLVAQTHDHRLVVRWRAAHSLGAFPTQQNADALVALLESDPNEQVRYGAIRSLVEMASRADPLTRQHIVGALIARVPAMKKSAAVLRELQASAFITPSLAPENWGRDMAKIFNALIDDADDMSDIETWSSVAAKVSKLGVPAHATA